MIGDRIRTARENLNISQTELAKRIQVSKQTLYKYEKGIVTNIPLDNIEKLSNALRVTPEYLMGWDKSTAPFSPLTPDEEIHMRKYRRLSPVDRGKIDERIDVLLEDEREKERGALVS